MKLTIKTLRDTFAIPCSHSLRMENICDSNEPFELYAINLCETFTERDYWGALLDKHLRRGRLVWRSDLIKASLKETSSYGVSFVFFFCSSFLSSDGSRKMRDGETWTLTLSLFAAYFHPLDAKSLLTIILLSMKTTTLSLFSLEWTLIWFDFVINIRVTIY